MILSLFLGSVWVLQLPWLCFWPHAGTRWSWQSSHVGHHILSDTASALHLLPNPPQPAKKVSFHFQTRKPQLRNEIPGFPKVTRNWTLVWFCGPVSFSAGPVSLSATFSLAFLDAGLGWRHPSSAELSWAQPALGVHTPHPLHTTFCLDFTTVHGYCWQVLPHSEA